MVPVEGPGKSLGNKAAHCGCPEKAKDNEKESNMKLRDLWDTLTTRISRVIDPETGEWMEEAQVRSLGTGLYLYVDDKDGYSILEASDVASLTLKAE